MPLTVEQHLWCAVPGVVSLGVAVLAKFIPAQYFSFFGFSEPAELPAGRSVLYSMMRRDPVRQANPLSTQRY